MAAVIHVQDLVKDYGSFRAVDGISFDVQQGEVFALLGPNGAGKTTMCEILEALRSATAGTVEVLGIDVTRSPNQVRERIGVLPQDFRAYDTLTCRENLAYFAALFHARPDLDNLLATVGLTDKRDKQYDTLSGGLKQRLGIAISLVNDPELVFLDEPTTGLDPRARRDTWAVIEGLKRQGKTVLLTTHYMEEAQILADRVAIINRGKLVDLDTAPALIERHAPGRTVFIDGADGLAAKLGHVAHDVRTEDGRVYVHVADDEAMALVLRTIARSKSPGGLQVETPTLEDVFLHLTGEQLGGDE